MGRKKLSDLAPISNTRAKNVTYCKRKRGLIKKAMELVQLCDQQICLVIFDESKKRVINYNSTGFDITQAQ